MFAVILFALGCILNSFSLPLYRYDEKGHEQNCGLLLCPVNSICVDKFHLKCKCKEGFIDKGDLNCVEVEKTDYTLFSSNTMISEKTPNYVFVSTGKNTKRTISNEIRSQSKDCGLLFCPVNSICVDKFHLKCKCKEGFIDKGNLDCVEESTVSNPVINFETKEQTTENLAIFILSTSVTFNKLRLRANNILSSSDDNSSFKKLLKTPAINTNGTQGNGYNDDENGIKYCRDPGQDVNAIRTENALLDARRKNMDSGKNEFPQGFSLYYKCKEGYSLEGESILLCLFTGKWSSEIPICYNSRPESTLSKPTINFKTKMQITKNSTLSVSITINTFNSIPNNISSTSSDYSPPTKLSEITAVNTNAAQDSDSSISKNTMAYGIVGALLIFTLIVAASLFQLKRRDMAYTLSGQRIRTHP